MEIWLSMEQLPLVVAYLRHKNGLQLKFYEMSLKIRSLVLRYATLLIVSLRHGLQNLANGFVIHLPMESG